MPYEDPVREAEAEALLRGFPRSRQRWQRLHSENNFTYRLFTIDGSVIVKYAGWNDDGLRREHELLQRLPSYGVRVPAVLASSADIPDLAPHPFVVMKDLGTRSLVDHVHQRCGQPQLRRWFAALKQLRSVPADLPGGRAEAGWLDDWWRWVRQCKGGELCGHVLDAKEQDALLSIAAWDAVADDAMGFVHGDLSAAHAMIDDHGAVVLIDWENAGAGLWPLDLANILAMECLFGRSCAAAALELADAMQAEALWLPAWRQRMDQLVIVCALRSIAFITQRYGQEKAAALLQRLRQL